MTAAAVFRACPRVNGCPFVTTRHLRALDLRPKARTIALALVVSTALHLGAVAALAPQGAVVMTEGGGDAAPAALGTSFEDFAMGSTQPAPMTEAQPPDAVEPPPVPQQTAQQTALAPLVPAAIPDATRPPEQAMQPVMDAPAPEDAVLPQMAEPVAPQQPMAPSPAETTPHQQAEAMEASRPDPVAPTEPPPEAISPDATSPDTSPRPPARPSELAAPPPPPRPAPQQTAAAPASPPGNAQQNAQRGSQQGTDGQAAHTTDARPATTQAGNAAASNYPGEVMRRIQRVRQVRSPARGRVIVAFGIAADGSLASASVARTSGSAALDQVALDHIRRAGPFPAPPAGAQRQFSFEFVGR